MKGIAADVCGLSLRGLDASNPLLIYPDTENRNVFGIFIFTKYIQRDKMYIPNCESEVLK